jgi:hypothetical protein
MFYPEFYFAGHQGIIVCRAERAVGKYEAICITGFQVYFEGNRFFIPAGIVSARVENGG